MADRRGPKLKGPVNEKEMKIFEGLCEIQCTLKEIASAFDVTKDTIIKRIEEWYGEKFSTVFQQKKDKGKISLRRGQWKKAVDQKSVPMLIWLGKQYLEQTDKQDSGGPIEDLVFTSSIGEGGQIIQSIRSARDWESQKTFDIKASLEKIQNEAEDNEKATDEKAD